MNDPNHPAEIEDATDAAILVSELPKGNHKPKGDLKRLESEGTKLIIVGEVDYWNSDDQQSYRFDLWFETDLHSGKVWLMYRQSRYGNDDLPEDWTEAYTAGGGRH